MKEILTQLFTGKDGATHDVGRWSWAISLVAVIGAAIGNWLHGAVIDIQSLAMALGGVAGTHAAALWGKAKTEPDVPPKDTP